MPFTPNTDPWALAKELSEKTHYIHGERVASKSGKTFDVIYPATSEIIAQAAFGEAADVEAAVADAKAAQAEWKQMPARDRGKLVAACGEALKAHVEELGRLVALETGKALRTESRVEASVLSDAFTFFGGLGSELKGQTIPFNPKVLAMTVPEPLGVVGAIIPWNVPMLLMALKVCPALVAGNTVVVKTAEEAPLACLRVAEICGEILPKGVFNMISGFGPEAGAPIVEHKDIAKVTFTGSVETGIIVNTAAAKKLVPCTLELGGKSPMVILEDADLDKAVAGAITGMRFTRQGQSCTAASRILIHESLHDVFVDRLTAAVNAMKIGDPLDEETDIGTIISPGQFERVNHYLAAGKEIEGATAHECGELPADEKYKDGLYVKPTIFTGMDNDSKLAREEIFGPVTVILKFSDYDEAIEMANDTEYGLASTVWTTNLSRGHRVAQQMEAGINWVNCWFLRDLRTPFGGMGLSGFGREGGQHALNFYSEQKNICVKL